MNVTIGASNINSLAANTATCQAAITFTNGLRTPTQPSVSNGGTRISYSYQLGDGQTYTVQATLLITTTSGFASVSDLLGNPYQVITGVSGTRVYTHIPSGTSLTSTITGVQGVNYTMADQRFYPYSLLAAAPGVYTTNTSPFFDNKGVGFSISPSAPQLGLAVGQGTQYNATSLFFTTPTASVNTVLTEQFYTTLPSVAQQRQTYTFQN